MSVSKAPLFTGCATALVTPFLPDLSLDLPALRRLILRQIDAGIDALVLLGTTGEPCTLSMTEREAVITASIETAAGKVPILIGTGSNDTRRAIEYAKQAKALGADGHLCVTPYYNKATQAGLIRHFSMIADACTLPMLLYNVPGRTGVSVQAKTVATLAQHPNITGIKEASGSITFAAQIIKETSGLFPLYCGNDDAITPLMSIGARGAISVCSNLLPKQTRAITQACLNGFYSEARDMQMKLLPLINLLFSQVSPIPIKAALHMAGEIHDVLRLPLTPMEEPERSKLHALLKEMEIIS